MEGRPPDLERPTFQWVDLVARMVDNIYKFLVGKPKGKKRLRRPRNRGEDNISMDHRKIG
jgi:hypothetical protein